MGGITVSRELETAARYLAQAHAKAEPKIREIYLFPPEGKDEIRLVELDPTTIPSEEEFVPFYFAADPGRGVRFPSAVALILPNEKGRVRPPTGWGGWDRAIKIWPRGKRQRVTRRQS